MRVATLPRLTARQTLQRPSRLDHGCRKTNRPPSVLRGLHLQRGEASQAKLVRCVVGEIIDLIVDLRRDSATYGQWRSYHLSETNHRQLYIPREFAHGFLVLSEQAKFLYKVDNGYAPSSELCIRYDDPQLAIPWESWGIAPEELILSDKDLRGIFLADYTASLS